MNATLLPRYENKMIFHYRGGNTQLLEEELVTRNPPHDDIKDALTNAIDGAVRPTQRNYVLTRQPEYGVSSRFGGRC